MYFAAAGIYWVLSSFLSSLQIALERRLSRHIDPELAKS
jgi:ABC-type amino acid transport system permease subunit